MITSIWWSSWLNMEQISIVEIMKVGPLSMQLLPVVSSPLPGNFFYYNLYSLWILILLCFQVSYRTQFGCGCRQQRWGTSYRYCRDGSHGRVIRSWNPTARFDFLTYFCFIFKNIYFSWFCRHWLWCGSKPRRAADVDRYGPVAWRRRGVEQAPPAAFTYRCDCTARRFRQRIHPCHEHARSRWSGP